MIWSLSFGKGGLDKGLRQSLIELSKLRQVKCFSMHLLSYKIETLIPTSYNICEKLKIMNANCLYTFPLHQHFQ